jgi:hypothetical protein
MYESNIGKCRVASDRVDRPVSDQLPLRIWLHTEFGKVRVLLILTSCCFERRFLCFRGRKYIKRLDRTWLLCFILPVLVSDLKESIS